MITFKQLAGGTPPDIEVTTDDHNAELAAMTDAFEAYEAETGETLIAASRLDQASMEGDELMFVIPGEEASAVAECFENSDAWESLPLSEQLEKWNDEAVERAERAAEAAGGGE